MMNEIGQPADVLRHFAVKGEILSVSPYGGGHINATFLASTAAGGAYILQRINSRVFIDPPAVMENIQSVTAYLRAAYEARGEDAARRTLCLVPALDKRCYYRDAQGAYWRVYVYVPHTKAYAHTDSPALFAAAGKAFGRFHRMLASFPAQTLHITIPRFHDTPHRMAQLDAAVAADPLCRVNRVQKELDQAYAYRDCCGTLATLQHSGRLPLRVTHNDAKLSNVLFDEDTNEARCIVDLDTVTPGLLACDFGDALRSGANAAPNEREPEKAALRLDMAQAYAQAYLGEMRDTLTKEELESLPYGVLLMSVELGVRYLTDYINGDIYFNIEYEEQNLQRARVQLQLAADICRKQDVLAQRILSGS